MMNNTCNLPNKSYLVQMTDADTGQVILVRLNESVYFQYKQILKDLKCSDNIRKGTIVFNKDLNNNPQVKIRWNE